MRHHSLRVLFLSCFLGLTAGSGLLPLSSIQISVQAAEQSSQDSQDGAIKACTGQSINLGAPQLTEADLKMLTGCGSGIIPQLLEALKSRDWKVKVIAAHTLGLFGKQAQSVIPELSGLMQDENADVRFAVAQALGDIGTEAVVPVLAKALQDKDENVRVSAADAFLKIGTVAKPAKPVLIDALWDGNWYVRSRAAATISNLGLEESDIPNLVELSIKNHGYDGALVSLMITIFPPTRNKPNDLPLFFIKALQSSDAKVRHNAVIALGQISVTKPGTVHLAESQNALFNLIQDNDTSVRRNVVKALGNVLKGFKLKHKQASQERFAPYTHEIDTIESVLLGTLEDSDFSVRQASAESLKELSDFSINNSKTILALSQSLQDSIPIVRQSAVNSMLVYYHRLSTDSTIPSILRKQLLERIYYNLVKALSDIDPSVRQDAIESFNFIGIFSSIQEKEVLLLALSDTIQNQRNAVDLRRDAIKALWNIHSLDFKESKKINDLLTKALQEPDLEIQQQAAIALRKIGKLDSKSAITILTNGLRQGSPLVSLDAIIGINEICTYDSNYTVGCPNTKNVISTLPILVDILRRDSPKALRYAATLLVSKIKPMEISILKVCREMLTEESVLGFRDNVISVREHLSLALSNYTHKNQAYH